MSAQPMRTWHGADLRRIAEALSTEYGDGRADPPVVVGADAKADRKGEVTNKSKLTFSILRSMSGHAVAAGTQCPDSDVCVDLKAFKNEISYD